MAVDNKAKRSRKIETKKTLRDMDKVEIPFVYSQVVALHFAGHTDEDIADQLGLSQRTVYNLRERTSPEMKVALRESKTTLISELVEENLEKNLRAMTKIVEVTNDEVWLKAQRAPELATFFGVISDKTARIFAAIERADERNRLERERQTWETNPQQSETVRVGAN